MTFVNEVRIDEAAVEEIASAEWKISSANLLPQVDASALVAQQLLKDSELALLREHIMRLQWQPVGVSGIASEYQSGDHVGSWRASIYQEVLAQAIWHRLAPCLPQLRAFDEHARTDWDHHELWRPIGLNPLLRLIRYRDAGLLVPHYDAPYIQSEAVRTLTTLVVYLACDPDVIGGQTRFIRDAQMGLPHDQRDYADWTRAAQSDEIIASVAPVPGSGLVFDHRILHDSAPLSAPVGSKIIMRTDVLYERA